VQLKEAPLGLAEPLLFAKAILRMLPDLAALCFGSDHRFILFAAERFGE